MLKRRIKKGIKYIQAFYKFYYFHVNEINKIQNADILFVLPYYQTGGAERVHLNIVKSVKDKSLCVLFTHNSATDNFKNDFLKYSKIIEINSILNKKNSFISQLLKKRITKAINKNISIKSVFSSNTNYFYELLPHIRKDIIKVDLIHAISNENDTIVEHYINSSNSISHRIVINNRAYNDVLINYNNYGVDKVYEDKIKVIENAITINEQETLRKRDEIRIGFVGRWSKEKRPELFLKIAKRINEEYPFIKFVMAGIGMKSNIKKINEFGISFLGEITDDIALNEFYKSLTFILITSYREGFPMVISEAMTQGVIPVSTNVGGVGEHITSFENGVLVRNEISEDEIVKQFVDALVKLVEDKSLTSKLSLNAFNYSREYFNIKTFNKEYRKYLLQEN